MCNWCWPKPKCPHIATGPGRTSGLDHLAQNQTLRARRGRFGSPTFIPLTLAVTSSILSTHNSQPLMAEIKRSTLFGKLNPLGYKSIEAATIFCKMRGNPYVETVHWLHQLLAAAGLRRAAHHQALRPRRLAAGRRSGRRAGPAAARRHRDQRFLPAHRDRAPAGLSLSPRCCSANTRCAPAIWSLPFSRPIRSSNVFLGLSREFAKIKTRAAHRRLCARSSPVRPKTPCAPATARA